MYEKAENMEARAVIPASCTDFPRESVEALMNAVGDRMCRAVSLIDEVMSLQYGDADKANMACEPVGTGFYGLAMALNRDSRILLERAEVLRKRFGG